MQPSNPTAGAQLIPASHLPSAMATVSSSKRQDAALLATLQSQLNYLMGKNDDKREDVVMVNPHGRIVEVAGQYVDEWIGKPGFRAATPEEESNYRKAVQLQTPEYLKRQEKRRLQEESKVLDELESDQENDNIKITDLMHANVTESQKTGALNPDQVKDLQSHPQITGTEAPKAAESKSAPKAKTPPRRGRKTPSASDIADV